MNCDKHWNDAWDECQSCFAEEIDTLRKERDELKEKSKKQHSTILELGQGLKRTRIVAEHHERESRALQEEMARLKNLHFIVSDGNTNTSDYWKHKAEALQEKVAELTKKGEDLCCAFGNTDLALKQAEAKVVAMVEALEIDPTAVNLEAGQLKLIVAAVVKQAKEVK